MNAFTVTVVGGVVVVVVGWVAYRVYQQWWIRFGPLVVPSLSEPDDGGVWRLGVEPAITDEDLTEIGTSDLRELRGWLVSRFTTTVLGERRFELTLQSHADAEVLVTGIEAVVESREPADFDSIVTSPPAGALRLTFIGFDLREGQDLRARTVDMRGWASWTDDRFFRDDRVVLASKGIHPFAVLSRTGNEVVTWRLRIDYQIHGVSRSMIVPAERERPLVSADAAVAGEFWWAGVAGLPEPPYLRRATPEELLRHEPSHGR